MKLYLHGTVPHENGAKLLHFRVQTREENRTRSGRSNRFTAHNCATSFPSVWTAHSLPLLTACLSSPDSPFLPPSISHSFDRVISAAPNIVFKICYCVCLYGGAWRIVNNANVAYYSVMCNVSELGGNHAELRTWNINLENQDHVDKRQGNSFIGASGWRVCGFKNDRISEGHISDSQLLASVCWIPIYCNAQWSELQGEWV